MYPEPKPETVSPDDFSDILQLLFVCLKAMDKKEPAPKKLVPEQYPCRYCTTINSRTNTCSGCGMSIFAEQRLEAHLKFDVQFYPENFPRAELAKHLIQRIISNCLEGLGLRSCTISTSLNPEPQPVSSEPKEEK